jgi:hypothetical protein
VREAVNHLQTTPLAAMGQTYCHLRDTLINFERQRLFGIPENSYMGEALSTFGSEVQLGGFHDLEMQSANDVMLQFCNFDEPGIWWSGTDTGSYS